MEQSEPVGSPEWPDSNDGEVDADHTGATESGDIGHGARERMVRTPSRSPGVSPEPVETMEDENEDENGDGDTGTAWGDPLDNLDPEDDDEQSSSKRQRTE